MGEKPQEADLWHINKAKRERTVCLKLPLSCGFPGEWQIDLGAQAELKKERQQQGLMAKRGNDSEHSSL